MEQQQWQATNAGTASRLCLNFQVCAVTLNMPAANLKERVPERLLEMSSSAG
jgi:hypothetical protein